MSFKGTTSGASKPSTITKKRKNQQKYNSAWEVEPEFHGWLKEISKGFSYYFCSSCCTDLSVNAGKLDIRRHVVGTKKIYSNL